MKRKVIFAINLLVLIFAIQVNAGSGKEVVPKNIIIMIGDGMGVNQVYTSLLSDKDNAFKNFISIGLSVTCSADALITDSGAGATALFTGYRTNNHFIGVDPDNVTLKNIMEYAQDNSLSTGVVATSSITHATPAGFVTHVKHRNEEEEIAEQFITSGIDVAIGGGRKFFNERKDNQDLVKKLQQKGYTVFNTIDEVKDYKGKNKFFGLLEKEALEPAADRDYSLADMTKAAIKRLSQNSKGFVLMVEGSQIDWGGHANSYSQVSCELKDFNKAINAVLEFAKSNGETLVLVTGDHETGGLSIVGGDKDGSNLKIAFAIKDHSANAMGVFAFGPGEDQFRGIYNNYMIGRKIIGFLNPSLSWK